jgi:ribosome-associated protein
MDVATVGASMTRDVAIRGETIRLGQLLKLSGVAEGGGEAKDLIAGGAVFVNGERETRRGRQLRPGDQVRIGDEALTVVAAPGSSNASASSA